MFQHIVFNTSLKPDFAYKLIRLQQEATEHNERRAIHNEQFSILAAQRVSTRR